MLNQEGQGDRDTKGEALEQFAPCPRLQVGGGTCLGMLHPLFVQFLEGVFDPNGDFAASASQFTACRCETESPEFQGRGRRDVESFISSIFGEHCVSSRKGEEEAPWEGWTEH